MTVSLGGVAMGALSAWIWVAFGAGMESDSTRPALRNRFSCWRSAAFGARMAATNGWLTPHAAAIWRSLHCDHSASSISVFTDARLSSLLRPSPCEKFAPTKNRTRTDRHTSELQSLI